MTALTWYNPANMHKGPKEYDPNLIPWIGPLRGTAMTWTSFLSEPGSKESVEKMFFQDIPWDGGNGLKRGELSSVYQTVGKGTSKNIFNKNDDVLVSMPSSFISSIEPITEKNYQLETESSLIPLKDKNSNSIQIPTFGFKRAYDAYDIDDHFFAKKPKSDKLDEDETMPNFIYNLEEASAGDLMPAITEVLDNHQRLPAGPAGIA